MLPFAFTRLLKQRALVLSLLIVCLFLAVRYNYGNDYQTYREMFYYGSLRSYIEPGFGFLSKLFSGLGFYYLVAFISIINITVLYFFIKCYVAENYRWMAVSIYILSYELMLINASAMRQSIAISLCIIATIIVLNKKNLLYSIALVLIAQCFHRSAAAMLIFLLYFYCLEKYGISIIGFIVLSLVEIVVAIIVSAPLAGYLAPKLLAGDDFYVYIDSMSGGTISSGLGVLMFLLLFGYGIAVLDFKNRVHLFILLSYQFQILFLVGGITFAILSRFSMYFEIFNVAYYPLLIKQTNVIEYKISLAVLLFALTIWRLMTFFSSYIWNDGFGVYKTIFSAPDIIANIH